jgi:hypothetical protein
LARSTPAAVLCLVPHQSPFRPFHLIFGVDPENEAAS